MSQLVILILILCFHWKYHYISRNKFHNLSFSAASIFALPSSNQPSSHTITMNLREEVTNPIREIKVQKLVLNISVGQSGDSLICATRCSNNSVAKPLFSPKLGILHARSFGIRRNEKIAWYVTVRGNKAMQLLKSGLKVKEYELLRGSFSDTSCFGFDIQEHINWSWHQAWPFHGYLWSWLLCGASHVLEIIRELQTRMQWNGSSSNMKELFILNKSQNIGSIQDLFLTSFKFKFWQVISFYQYNIHRLCIYHISCDHEMVYVIKLNW